MRFKGLVFVVGLLFFQNVFGQRDSVRSVYDMSMVELIGMKVSLATKERQDQLSAPGQITVYNQEFINENGFNTIADLSAFTTGFGYFNIYGEKVFETRGRRDVSFNNNKHLVLYDGVPLNFARNFKAPMDFELPLYFAERVEFLRGPGSALYGASAFYGVIEYTPEESEGNTVFGTRNGFSSIQGAKYYQAKLASPFNLGHASIMVSYHQQNPSEAFLGADSLTRDANFRYYDDQNSLFIASKAGFNKGYFKGVDLGLVIMSRTTGIGEFWGGPSSQLNELNWTSIIPYVKYHRSLNDRSEIKAWIKYNESIERGAFETNNVFTINNIGELIYHENGQPVSLNIFQQYQRAVHNYEGQVEWGYETSKNSDLKVGLNYNGRKQHNADSYSRSFFTPDSTNESRVEDVDLGKEAWYHIVSGYAQFKKQLDVLENLEFTLGARQDVGLSESSVFQRLSPRVGVVQKITDKFAVKFLYGTALRTPGLKEFGANADAVSNGVDSRLINTLKAEVVKTTELTLAYQNEAQQFSIGAYNSQVANEIMALSANNAIPYYVNSDTSTAMRGVEIDYTRVLTQNVFLKTNLATSRSLNYFADLFGTTQYRWNAMLGYKPKIKYAPKLSIVNRWRSGYLVGSDNTTANISTLDLTASGTSQNVTIRVQVRNALNSVFRQPANLSRMSTPLGRYDFPLAGRTYWLTIELGS